MTSNNFFVVGIRTSQREWFSLSVEDDTWSEAGLEPNSGCSEDEIRVQLRDLGMSEIDIEERFRNARKWMPSLIPSVASEN